MNKEKTTDKLLIFMKDTLEDRGNTANEVYFNFAFSETQKHLNANALVEIISEGEDLTSFKNICRISDEDFTTLINYCITNNYIKYQNKNYENFTHMVLTDTGLARAKSVKINSSFKMKVSSLLAHPFFNTIVSVVISALVSLFVSYYMEVSK